MPSKLEGELAEAQVLIQHLLAIGERSKAALARKLHDDIAELMVAALMGLTAAIPHLPVLEVDAQRQLGRAKATLGAAISQSRRLMEELRPSLVEWSKTRPSRWQRCATACDFSEAVSISSARPAVAPY